MGGGSNVEVNIPLIGKPLLARHGIYFITYFESTEPGKSGVLTKRNTKRKKGGRRRKEICVRLFVCCRQLAPVRRILMLRPADLANKQIINSAKVAIILVYLRLFFFWYYYILFLLLIAC